MDGNNDKIDAAVLALLWLNLQSSGMAWKGFDWAAMDRLHAQGLISNPVGNAKSVRLPAEGLEKGERMFHELFNSSAMPSTPK